MTFKKARSILQRDIMARIDLINNPITTVYTKDENEKIIIELRCAIKVLERAAKTSDGKTELHATDKVAPCPHKHTHVENLTSGSICDDCGNEL